MTVLDSIISANKLNNKQLAVLIDPDKTDEIKLRSISTLAVENKIDYFFVGGSLLVNNYIDNCIKNLKDLTGIPVVLFPGNTMQLSRYADAILFLSLISGRNAEMLIGRHVIAAPYLRQTSLEVIGTGYMLIESGKPTAVSYMSHSVPIPSDKDDIAMCTAIAGEMLGLKLIYMDAGSGAENTINASMIEQVRNSISIPIIAGGGINTPEKAMTVAQAGADVIVIGNIIEKEPAMLKEIASSIRFQKTE